MVIQTIITEHELEIIHKLIKFRLYQIYPGNKDFPSTDDVEDLQKSLPQLTRDMEFEDDCI
jgi:hypothetical protein